MAKGNDPKETREQKKARLQKELADIRAEEDTERAAAWEARKERLLSVVDALLVLVSEHGRTSCADENPHNIGRCDRCTLLDIKEGRYWPDEYDVEIHVERRG